MKPDLRWSDQAVLSRVIFAVLPPSSKHYHDDTSPSLCRRIEGWDVPEKEDQPNSNTINDLCFSPDGATLVVAVGNRVLIYDGEGGELLHSLRGHKDTVYTVSYSQDGKHFASGGADHTVIIWTNKADGILKYTHNESIVRLAYSSGTTKLASCTQLDFGLWGQEQKSVNKHKVHAKILSADWSSDGLLLALGFIDGTVSIRDTEGLEKITITRGGPVWCLAWCPLSDDGEVLALGCWDQTLSFYLPSGEQHMKDRKLGYNPCSLAYLNGGMYMVIGGSDCKATLYSKEGLQLCTVCERKAWVWAVGGRTSDEQVAVGGEGGKLEVYKLQFEDLTAIHEERYAFRDKITDVMVQHLVSEQKVRIKCRDYVQDLAIFRNKLAVRLPDKVHVYELTHSHREDSYDRYDLRYRLKEKIYLTGLTDRTAGAQPKSWKSLREKRVVDGERKQDYQDHQVPDRDGYRDGHRDGHWDGHREDEGGISQGQKSGKGNRSFLLVTWGHIALCEGRVLHLYDLSGAKVREWILDAVVRCASVSGGPEGAESLLLGLENGLVVQVLVNSAFPIQLVKVGAAVVCCDLSLHRRQVAVVDESSNLILFDLSSTEVLFQETGASRVAFNSCREDMLCYSGNGKLYLRNGNFPLEEQHLEGDVVGYRGARAISLKGTSLSIVDVSLTKTLYRHVEARDFDQAHAVACLGVTQVDWGVLGSSALQAINFDIARKAYIRLKDVRFIDVLMDIQFRASPSQETSSPEDPQGRSRVEADASAEILAHEGMYQDAAKAWARNGMADKAISMFIDLRQWEEAKVLAASSGSGIDGKELTRRQAEWAEEIGDWAAASDLFVQCREPLRAAHITCNNRGEGWQDSLLEIVRSVTKKEVEVLQVCGRELSSSGFDSLAKEAYLKMDDFGNLMALFVKNQNWMEALKLSEQNAGKFDDAVYLPYAFWLRDKGRFDDALGAFLKAGRRDLSRAMTERLINNAVTKRRFNDASFYYWKSSTEAFAAFNDPKASQQEVREALEVGEEHSRLADLYHAFHHVHCFTTDPFTSLQPEVLLHVSRFLINSLGDSESPPGISRAHTLYTLAKQAKVLGAFKLARFAYERLQRQRVPPRWQDQIDLDMLNLQAKPVRDSPELFAACFRCGASNPLLSPFTPMPSSSSSPTSTSTPYGGSGSASGNSSSLWGRRRLRSGGWSAWGDSCTTCRHPFIRSFINFEALPLVEFQPEPGISDEEALEMIRADPKQVQKMDWRSRKRSERSEHWRQAKEGEADVMMNTEVDDDTGDVDDRQDRDGEDVGGDELFNQCINAALEAQEESCEYVRVVVPATCLRRIRRQHVFRVPPGTSRCTGSFYKNMMPEIPLALSQPCGRFFHEEDFEFAYLKHEKGRCPFSRLEDVGDYDSC